MANFMLAKVSHYTVLSWHIHCTLSQCSSHVYTLYVHGTHMYMYSHKILLINRNCLFPSSWVQHWFPDPTLAVSPRAADRQREPILHQMDQQAGLGIQNHRPPRGRPAMGGTKKQTHDELREAQPRSTILLRQEHHQEGAKSAIRVSVRVRSRIASWSLLYRATESVEYRRGTRGSYHDREEAECSKDETSRWAINSIQKNAESVKKF